MRETPRAFTPYGFGPVEKALLPIKIGLARQEWRSTYYRDGSIPGMFVVPGPDISTPQQIRQLQEALRAMAGDIGAKHSIVVLPPGSKADPMKAAPLADQTDEWIAAEITMPFMLTPMDIGITPRVSAVQSASESRELSHINSDKGAQHRVEPVCADLKGVIFDFVIQKLFKQQDMEWSWGLQDRGKNREAAIQEHIQLIGVGIESIDEARTDMGKTPWGLPETSVPLLITQGAPPMPVSALADEDPAQGGALPGTPQALAAAPQKPGQPQQPRQQADDELTTPAHEASRELPATPQETRAAEKSAAEAAEKARQDAELEYLARHLRKGRTVAQFRADHLPAEAMAAAERARPKGVRAAVEAAKSAADAKRRQGPAGREGRRGGGDGAIRGAREAGGGSQAGQAQHAARRRSGGRGDGRGYAATMTAGSRDAAGDYEGTPEQDPEYIDGQAQDAAEAQRGYFQGLLQDIMGGLSIAMTTARLGLYAATLRRQYNASYGMTVMQAHPDYYIVWELGNIRAPLCPVPQPGGQEVHPGHAPRVAW